MNWPVIIIVGIIVLALIIFLVWKNQKDEKVVEKQLNNDFEISKDEQHDADTDKEITG